MVGYIIQQICEPAGVLVTEHAVESARMRSRVVACQRLLMWMMTSMTWMLMIG